MVESPFTPSPIADTTDHNAPERGGGNGTLAANESRAIPSHPMPLEAPRLSYGVHTKCFFFFRSSFEKLRSDSNIPSNTVMVKAVLAVTVKTVETGIG